MGGLICETFVKMRMCSIAGVLSWFIHPLSLADNSVASDKRATKKRIPIWDTLPFTQALAAEHHLRYSGDPGPRTCCILLQMLIQLFQLGHYVVLK